jgi:hypothetical protein
MRFARVMVAALAAAGTAAGGCAHERLPWPPPPDQIERINEGAREEKGYLRVEYVEPIASRAGVKVIKPIAIASIDDEQIAFRTRAGETQAVPTPLVRAVAIRDRGRGGLLGALAGIGVGLVTLGATWSVTRTGAVGTDGCIHFCNPREVAADLVLTAAVGWVIGYVIAGRRTFHFDRTP